MNVARGTGGPVALDPDISAGWARPTGRIGGCHAIEFVFAGRGLAQTDSPGWAVSWARFAQGNEKPDAGPVSACLSNGQVGSRGRRQSGKSSGWAGGYFLAPPFPLFALPQRHSLRRRDACRSLLSSAPAAEMRRRQCFLPTQMIVELCQMFLHATQPSCKPNLAAAAGVCCQASRDHGTSGATMHNRLGDRCGM